MGLRIWCYCLIGAKERYWAILAGMSAAVAACCAAAVPWCHRYALVAILMAPLALFWFVLSFRTLQLVVISPEQYAKEVHQRSQHTFRKAARSFARG
jgi:hypothetical protein